MDKEEAKNLLMKFQAGKCTDEEKVLIRKWLANNEYTTTGLSAEQLSKDLAEISKKLPLYRGSTTLTNWKVYTAAAAIFAVIFSGGYLFQTQNEVPELPIKTAVQQQDIVPGSNRATITLSNGKVIDLSNLEAGKVTEEEGVKITKTADNMLLYTIADQVATVKDQFNTIQTPRGGQFQVILPDGTHVWLNAATSLRYPVSFAANERKVELNGEAYFEVAKNPAKPFKVISHASNGKDQEIQVLGTHFNVQAYADEKETKTTLLKGSVQVVHLNTKITKKLTPGFQSALSENNQAFTVKKIVPREVMGWKQGNFVFDDESLPVIMRQIARWYDVDIKYENTTANANFFGGTISRDKNIAQVLEILELTGSVHFKTVGRSVVVMN